MKRQGNNAKARVAKKRPGTTFGLTVAARVGSQYAPYLRKHLRQAHRLVAGAPDELSLAIVGDQEMGDLHYRFMGIAGPTDVLTFELEHGARGRVTSGEVVVCLGEARRQARRRGTDVRAELLLYALHGLLHLSGFDDRTAADYRKMHRKEDEVLERIGVGAVFEREPRNPRRRPPRPRNVR